VSQSRLLDSMRGIHITYSSRMNGFKTVIKKKKWNPHRLKLFDWENCVNRVGNTDLCQISGAIKLRPRLYVKINIKEFILNLYFFSGGQEKKWPHASGSMRIWQKFEIQLILKLLRI
jgi:hypothetical protein